MPLVLLFHGWSGHGKDCLDWGWKSLSEREGFILVAPQGLEDCEDGADCEGKTSWNGVGSTESTKSGLQSCDPAYQPHNYSYTSNEIKKGYVHVCDWTTGYDDVGFVASLLEQVSNEVCIDQTRTYLYGCSNGGMFLHQLAQSLPNRFAAIASECGGKPHAGWAKQLPGGSSPISMTLITGDEDTTIPPRPPQTEEEKQGWDGYFYADNVTTLAVYQSHNRCQNANPRPYDTEYNGKGMLCTEVGYDCQGGASVTSCVFHGGHDINWGTSINSIADGPQFSWSFFKQHQLVENASASIILP